MLKTFEEVHKFLDQNAYRLYDKTPRFTIQFGLPRDGNAMIHLNSNGIALETINCFSWAQTIDIRRRFSYGDNHRSRSLNWLDTVKVLNDTIHLIEREVNWHEDTN